MGPWSFTGMVWHGGVVRFGGCFFKATKCVALVWRWWWKFFPKISSSLTRDLSHGGRGNQGNVKKLIYSPTHTHTHANNKGRMNPFRSLVLSSHTIVHWQRQGRATQERDIIEMIGWGHKIMNQLSGDYPTKAEEKPRKNQGGKVPSAQKLTLNALCGHVPQLDGRVNIPRHNRAKYTGTGCGRFLETGHFHWNLNWLRYHRHHCWLRECCRWNSIPIWLLSDQVTGRGVVVAFEALFDDGADGSCQWICHSPRNRATLDCMTRTSKPWPPYNRSSHSYRHPFDRLPLRLDAACVPLVVYQLHWFRRPVCRRAGHCWPWFELQFLHRYSSWTLWEWWLIPVVNHRRNIFKIQTRKNKEPSGYDIGARTCMCVWDDDGNHEHNWHIWEVRCCLMMK